MNELERIKNENDKLKEIDENKSELISISAHQLRTSLSALKWTLKMILNKELGDITDEQKNYIEKAINSNERSIVLVNYLLTFNHSDDISMTSNLKEVNLTVAVEKVASDFLGELKNKKIELIFNKPEELVPNIICDEQMMLVVLQNLIENAIKYSPDNSKITISIKFETESNNIELSFHDQGIGIKKEDQIKIFNKFFRAPNAIEKATIGSGLGLFITKNIVEKHNGKIWFESSLESGTTFFVTLPIH
jgi:signal transduction histidine kinase